MGCRADVLGNPFATEAGSSSDPRAVNARKSVRVGIRIAVALIAFALLVLCIVLETGLHRKTQND